MDKKICDFCGKFYSSNEECYCFLAEDDENESQKPHVEIFEDIKNKTTDAPNEPVNFLKEDSEVSYSALQKSVCVPKGYLFDENNFPENTALDSETSLMVLGSENMNDCIKQSEPSKSTAVNERSNPDSVSATEANNSFDSSDFALKELVKCRDDNEAQKVKPGKKSLIVSGKTICEENAGNKEPLIDAGHDEGTSASRLSAIHPQSHKPWKKKGFVSNNGEKTFVQIRQLHEHERTQTGEKPFACHSCEKRFTQQRYLKKHLLTHSKEKTFKCDFCLKMLKTKQSFDYHLRIHTGKKPYSCDKCGKAFVYKSFLNTHIKTHTEKKTFECYICRKVLKSKSGFEYHLRSHTREKPFSCDICGKTFTAKSSVKRHLLVHRGEESFE